MLPPVRELSCADPAGAGVQHYFTLHGPSGHLFGKDGLKICFETEDLALRWRDALKDAIGRLATGSDLVGRSVSIFQDAPIGREATQSAASMTPISSPGSAVSVDNSNLAKVCSVSSCQHQSHAVRWTSPSCARHTCCCCAYTCQLYNSYWVCSIPACLQHSLPRAAADRVRTSSRLRCMFHTAQSLAAKNL